MGVIGFGKLRWPQQATINIPLPGQLGYRAGGVGRGGGQHAGLDGCGGVQAFGRQPWDASLKVQAMAGGGTRGVLQLYLAVWSWATGARCKHGVTAVGCQGGAGVGGVCRPGVQVQGVEGLTHALP